MNEKLYNEFKSQISTGFGKIYHLHIQFYWNLAFGEFLDEDEFEEVKTALHDEGLIIW